MRFRLLGRTGVKVSCLSFGTMSFGGDADEATAARSSHARARRASTSSTPPTSTTRGARRRSWAGCCAVAGTRWCWPPRPTSPAATRGPTTGAAPATTWCARSRPACGGWAPTASTSITCTASTRHRPVREPAGAGRPGSPGQDPLSRLLELRRLAGSPRPGRWRALERLQPLAALQPMYNLLKRQAEVEILPMAQALGVAVVPYSPTAGGILTGKYRGGVRPEGTRLHTNQMYQNRYADSGLLGRRRSVRGAGGGARATRRRRWRWPGWRPTRRSPRCCWARARSSSWRSPWRWRIWSCPTRCDRRIAAITPEPPPATDRSEEKGAR